MIKVLNIGCGNFPLKDKGRFQYFNVDMLKLTPKQIDNAQYIRHDLTKYPYPFQSATFDRLYLSHVIEHIAEEEHDPLFRELHRITKVEGLIEFIYPEFRTIATNYLMNVQGKKEYWKACIYGRSGKNGMDHHKALIDTPDFVDSLRLRGIEAISSYPDKDEAYNTVLVCKRVEPMKTYEELLTNEVTARRA